MDSNMPFTGRRLKIMPLFWDEIVDLSNFTVIPGFRKVLFVYNFSQSLPAYLQE
jgi:hypothetical protein